MALFYTVYFILFSWCKKWHYFTPNSRLCQYSRHTTIYVMQAQETEIMHPCNKAIDTREEILDLITSTSRSARESELRPRIAKHLSGRVRPPGRFHVIIPASAKKLPAAKPMTAGKAICIFQFTARMTTSPVGYCGKHLREISSPRRNSGYEHCH